MAAIRKIVLAYSGGLDTSVILHWLQEHYQCEVCTFTANIGQGEEVAPAVRKAEALSAAQIFVEDLRAEFARDYIFPLLRSGAIYEGEYLLGTAIARPLIAKRLVEIAHDVNAGAIAHGATGKGNDQVRFELGAYALDPDIRIIAPWREWSLDSRSALIQYAEKHAVPIEKKAGKPPYSIDANLLHTSYEGGILEDPWQAPDESMWQRTASLHQAKATPDVIEIGFSQGNPVRLDDKRLPPASLLAQLNALAGSHGIGRIDIVENRYLGMKSRGCYETPGGTVLFKAHRAIESLTLDRQVQRLKDALALRYADLVYNGYWWSAERIALQKMIDDTQQPVAGTVRMQLFRGNAVVTGRASPQALFDARIASFESDGDTYDQAAATGFIAINALRLKLAARRGRS